MNNQGGFIEVFILILVLVNIYQLYSIRKLKNNLFKLIKVVEDKDKKQSQKILAVYGEMKRKHKLSDNKST